MLEFEWVYNHYLKSGELASPGKPIQNRIRGIIIEDNQWVTDPVTHWLIGASGLPNIYSCNWYSTRLNQNQTVPHLDP